MQNPRRLQAHEITLRYTATVSSAHRCQLKLPACSNPLRFASLRHCSSSNPTLIKLLNVSISFGSHMAAASPATSGKEDEFEQTTGMPDAIASNTGKPNPSYNDGNTKRQIGRAHV